MWLMVSDICGLIILKANNMVVYNRQTWVDDAIAQRVIVDTNVYVGAPIAYRPGDIATWNLNPAPIQGGSNVHNSALADMFQGPAGPLLQARLMTYAEVCFILAEAAHKGWSAGKSQQVWYESGARQAMPLRFRYPSEEIAKNYRNWENASSTLVQTPFTAQDGDDSSC